MTPLFDALAAAPGPVALLESTGGAPSLTRRSILALRPRAVLVAGPASVEVSTPEGSRSHRRDPVAVLRELLAETPPGRWPDEGGVVGVLAYDYARPRAVAEMPRLLALAVDRFVVVEGRGPTPPTRAPDPASVQLDAPLGAAAWRRPQGRDAPGFLDLPRSSNLTREAHRDLVLRIKEHIARGDIYQANLSQRFDVPFPKSGLALYAHLRRLSPAPFSGYFRAAGLEVVSASPERLLEVDGGEAATRPIAGTRPRSADPASDRALAADLLLSEKERAEHLMLVDLARNDLGKVAVTGSVHVDELMGVEDYAQVRHIVSNVRARLAAGHDVFDALLALFPGGTITGVPKRRCMEILDVLEPTPRGFYTGALFYATPSGRLDANILIRSAVVAGGVATFQTGGGIVADSDPDREYEETLHKAEGMRLALEAAL